MSLKLILNSFHMWLNSYVGLVNILKVSLGTHMSHELFIIWIVCLVDTIFIWILSIMWEVRDVSFGMWVALVDRSDPIDMTRPNYFFLKKEISIILKKSGNNYFVTVLTYNFFSFKIGVERISENKCKEHKTEKKTKGGQKKNFFFLFYWY